MNAQRDTRERWIMNEHILKRIKEINTEIYEAVEKLRMTKAAYDELVNLHDVITSKDDYDQKKADEIVGRAQKYFDENTSIQLTLREKEAALAELQSLLEEE